MSVATGSLDVADITQKDIQLSSKCVYIVVLNLLLLLHSPAELQSFCAGYYVSQFQV